MELPFLPLKVTPCATLPVVKRGEHGGSGREEGKLWAKSKRMDHMFFTRFSPITTKHQSNMIPLFFTLTPTVVVNHEPSLSEAASSIQSRNPSRPSPVKCIMHPTYSTSPQPASHPNSVSISAVSFNFIHSCSSDKYKVGGALGFLCQTDLLSHQQQHHKLNL